MTGEQHKLTGSIRIPLPPDEAFYLFTPRGEQEWVRGWQPRFPAPAADDTEPGTVFETSAHGEHTTWLVTERQHGKRICYARVTPGRQAGTVTVTLSVTGHSSTADHPSTTGQLSTAGHPSTADHLSTTGQHGTAGHPSTAGQHGTAGQPSSAGQHSEVEVTYRLTALTDTARHHLREFADGYPAYLQSWQEAIVAWVSRGRCGW